MDKNQLAALLRKNYATFISRVQNLSDTDLCYAPEEKWSAAQQLDHIVRAVKPVNMALGLPKFILKWRFGLANRPSKTYEQLVEKYRHKLQEGGRASGRFVPPVIGAGSKQALLDRLSGLVNSLARKAENLSEASLDTYILPHPLLGKLTLREMLYFTAYHVQHHGALVEKGLENRQASV